jgi:D-alanyl-D-alanine carboxypeptidase/D-alanyl-D-alanine-endopeptidase (penicillin-binding protein 4)
MGRLVLLILLVSSSISYADNLILSRRINHTLKRFKENINIGIVVRKIKSNRMLYHKNANRLYAPASNMKILTAVAGLVELGANFHYPTQLKIPRAYHSGATLNGNALLKFSGDPSLTSADLFSLIGKLAEHGIHTIKGSLLIDDGAFIGANFGKGWMWDDFHLCYSAPVNAAILDHNCMTVTVQPSKHTDRFAKIRTTKNQKFTPIINEILTTKQPTLPCKIKVHTNAQNRFTLQGCILQQGPAKRLDLAIPKPTLYIKQVLKKILAYYKITLTGDIIEGSTSEPMRVLVKHMSKPFPILLEHMMKRSDDLYAEVFAKSIGAAYYNKQGSWNAGMKAIRSVFSNEIHINLNHAKIVDGSGLSRYNLITPNDLDKVLQYAYTNFAIKPEFTASLPIAGVDGTLKHRMYWDKSKSAIRAKTGSMRSVSSLSGYAKTRHHGIVSFSILINGFAKHLDHYRALEDKICKILANY